MTVGPVPLPDVPVRVCATQTGVAGGVEKCAETARARSVSSTVVAGAVDPTAAVAPPVVREIPCPAGTGGVAVAVTTGSVAAPVDGAVVVTVGDGRRVTGPLGRRLAPPGRTLTQYACTGLG